MASTTIEVNKLLVHAHHGVMVQERCVGNTFEVTVHVDYPATPAVANDDLDATLNYAEVVDLIKHEMAVPSLLLEHVAGRIKDALLISYPKITSGMVRVAKLTPPIPGSQLESVAIVLHW